jgi:flagellar biosynthesis/type III secretory pathway chaperone
MNSNTTLKLDLLSSHIEQLKSALFELKTTLEDEAISLKQTHQAETLMAIVQRKEQQFATVNQLQAQVAELTQPNTSVTELLNSDLFTTFPAPLQQQIHALNAIIQACFDLNTSNGVSIQILNTLNQHTLDLISGKSATKINLYDASGESKVTSGQQNSLGKA